MSSKESGAQGRNRRKREAELEAERERERSGLNDEWLARLEQIGSPTFDPLGNNEWANNVATAMAEVIAKDATIPLVDRFKRVCEMIDRIASTQAKASVARRIREITKDAGVSTAAKDANADGTIPVGPGRSLRASSRTARGGAA